MSPAVLVSALRAETVALTQLLDHSAYFICVLGRHAKLSATSKDKLWVNLQPGRSIVHEVGFEPLAFLRLKSVVVSSGGASKDSEYSVLLLRYKVLNAFVLWLTLGGNEYAAISDFDYGWPVSILESLGFVLCPRNEENFLDSTALDRFVYFFAHVCSHDVLFPERHALPLPSKRDSVTAQSVLGLLELAIGFCS